MTMEQNLTKTLTAEPEKKSRLEPCIDCGRLISKWASTCPNCGGPVLRPSQPNAYPALRFIAGVFKFLAIAGPIVGFIVWFLILFQNEHLPFSVIAISFLWCLIVPLIWSVLLWAAAELILLLIKIEFNTSTLCSEDDEEEEAEDGQRQGDGGADGSVGGMRPGEVM